jgi:hypothetical protein
MEEEVAVNNSSVIISELKRQKSSRNKKTNMMIKKMHSDATGMTGVGIIMQLYTGMITPLHLALHAHTLLYVQSGGQFRTSKTLLQEHIKYMND